MNEVNIIMQGISLSGGIILVSFYFGPRNADYNELSANHFYINLLRIPKYNYVSTLVLNSFGSFTLLF